MLTMGYVSEIIQSRSLLRAIIPAWVFILLLLLRFWLGSQEKVWPTYAILTLALGDPPTWSLIISWCSANSNSVRNRAVSAGLGNIFSQAAAIVSANIYRQDDKPKYKRANSDLLDIAAGALLMCILARLYYIFRNKQEAKKWNAMFKEERERYVVETTGQPTDRLDFKLCTEEFKFYVLWLHYSIK